MTTLTPERLAELRRVAEAPDKGDWYSVKGYLSNLEPEDAEFIAEFSPPTCLALLDALAEAQQRADSLLEEHDYFLEESEKYGQLVARIIKALGKEWREETDDDAQTIVLGAITELQAERDRLTAQVSAMREAMGEEWTHVPARGYAVCKDCDVAQGHPHRPNCSRGRFFAALASAESEEARP